jgi:RND family efflux transporter MFP subunit
VKRSRIIAAGVSAAVIVALGAGYAYSRASASVTVTVAKATSQTLELSVDAAGKLVAGHPVVVYPAITSRITDLPVADGASVAAGDALASLDVTAQEASVAGAEAAVSAAKSTRIQLNGTGTSDKATAAKNAADRAVVAAQKQLDAARASANAATVRAPSAGVLVYGSGVAVGAGVGPGPLFTIVDTSALSFEAQVDEADVSGVQVGQKASVALDAFPGAPVSGSVTRVSPSAVTTATGGTAFPVLITMDAAAKRLLLGMSGHAIIALAGVPDAVSIPIQSVFTEGGTKNVYVLGANSKVTKTAVTLGVSTDTLVQVVSGIKAGDTVVTSLITSLADGETVTVK